ncbi:T9SS type A sorting domain-containing protein [Pseudotamlana agarivorans]|uniref:T9SS type A sorting domain-containing protein n=1 Tax=Pseudotamlana agarivorans TaxID=481183 RepID=UPI0008365328|nr:T9SS type A sorting domain-containing protein [Tamlana agarivorans]
MKKTTLLLLLLVSTFTFAQTVTLSSIDGETPGDFGLSSGLTLNVGTTYEFIIDYTGQETVGNDILVKILEGGSYADTADIFVEPVTAASGQAIIQVTPTIVQSSAILQVRSTKTTDFSESSQENMFLFNYKVDPSLSTNDFNKNKLAAYYNSKLDAVLVGNSVSGDYAIYDLSGRKVVNGVVSNEISTASLKSGLYILSTAQGVLKFVK